MYLVDLVQWISTRSSAAGEQADDVLGAVGDVVADAADSAVIRDDAAAVAVDQAADELLGLAVHDFLLPWLEGDEPAVFRPRAVLRQEAGPVLGVEDDLDAVFARSIDQRSALVGHDQVDRLSASLHDRRIFGVECNPELPHSS
jgi:hypothetical protein